VKVQEVAREFGVDYVLEAACAGGDRIRVTVQLIDAETDRHVWPNAMTASSRTSSRSRRDDPCDRRNAAGRVEPPPRPGERKPTGNMAAYECVLTAKVLHHRSTRDEQYRSAAPAHRALALDPNYAPLTHGKHVSRSNLVYDWCDDRGRPMLQVAAELDVALGLDDNDSDVHRILAALNLTRKITTRPRITRSGRSRSIPTTTLSSCSKASFLTWLDGLRKASTGSRRRCVSTRTTRSVSEPSRRACYCAEKYADAAEAFSRITRPDHTIMPSRRDVFAQMGNAVALLRTPRRFSARANFSGGNLPCDQHYKRDVDRQRQ